MPSLLRLIAVTSQSLLWESVLGVGVEWGEFSPMSGCKLALVPANYTLCVREKPQKGIERKTEREP